MIDAEVVQMRIPAEQVAFLFVNHQLLDELVILGHVQMVTGRCTTGPVKLNGLAEDISSGRIDPCLKITLPAGNVVMIGHLWGLRFFSF